MAKKKRSREEIEQAERKDTYDWIQSIVTALIICIVIFLFFVRVIDVRGDSMNPTLHDGQKMLVSGLFYKPKQGDVVIFKTDDYDSEKALVKRVIATEGQVVNIDFDRGIVYVNDEPYESISADPGRCRTAACSSWAITEINLRTAVTSASATWTSGRSSAALMP